MTHPTDYKVGNLLHYARNWYLTYEGQQIPHDEWDSAKKRYDINVLWDIVEDDIKLEGYDLDFIPVLAAISVGKKGADLLGVCKHHDLQPTPIRMLHIIGLDQRETSAAIGKSFEQPLSNWSICNEIVQAISLDKDMATAFASTLNDSYSRHFRLACLFSENELMWPVTELKAIAENPLEQRYSVSLPGDIHAFINTEIDFTSLPNALIINLLERSGQLLPGLDIEHGMFNTFYRDLFTKVGEGGFDSLEQVAKAINEIEDPHEISRMSKVIIHQLLNSNLYDSLTNGVHLYHGLYKALDQEKYAEIFESKVLRVCATSPSMLNFMSKMHPEIEILPQHTDFFEKPDKILSTYLSEQKNLRPEDYRATHFHALGRIAGHLFDQQSLDAIDLNGVARQSLAALETYMSAHHVNGQGKETQEYKERASKNLCDFLKFAVKNAEIDYSQFTGFNSESRLLLADAGFEVKKIPNLTRRERGHILSDQLGI